MSLQALTWAFVQPDLSTGAKFVLVALANYADESGYCFPSMKTLCSITNQSESSVRRHLQELTESGHLLSQVRYRENGSQTSNGYWIQTHPSPPPLQNDTPPLSNSEPPPVTVTPPEPKSKPKTESTGSLPSVENARTPAQQVNDAIMDTLCRVWDLVEIPPKGTPQHGKFMKAFGIYKKAGLTPAQIEQVHDLYLADPTFSKCNYSMLAVANNAQELLTRPQKQANVAELSAPMRGIANWRPRAQVGSVSARDRQVQAGHESRDQVRDGVVDAYGYVLGDAAGGAGAD